MKQCRSRPCIKNKKKNLEEELKDVVSNSSVIEDEICQDYTNEKVQSQILRLVGGNQLNLVACALNEGCWIENEIVTLGTDRQQQQQKKSILEALWRSDYSLIKNVCRRKESYDSHDKRTPPFLVDWRLTTLPLQHNQELDWIQENTTQLFNRSNVSGNWFDWF